MDFSSKKLTWIDYFNDSTDRNFRDETLTNSFNDIPSLSIDNNNYQAMDPDIDLSHNTDHSLHHPPVRIPSIETSTFTSVKHQQNNLAKCK